MPKKIPVRQCLGCREHKPKPELIRVVRSPEGVCPDPACLHKARKSRALERAFSAPLPDAVWAALEEQMKAGEEDG